MLARAVQRSPEARVATATTVPPPPITRRTSKEPLGARVIARLRSDERPVPVKRDLPRDAVAILVDLELDLDAAVFAAQLELRGRAVCADAANPDAVATLGGGERSDGKGGDAATARARTSVMWRKLNIGAPLIGDDRQARDQLVGAAMRHWSQVGRQGARRAAMMEPMR